MSTLFDPIKVGEIAVANRIVMAPLTRNRAVGGIANDLMAEYYRQRASAGLIIAEASQISPMAVGYIDTPGIHSPEQVAGWRKVTEAVHGAGGKIVLQLWHVGRISHTSLLPDGAAPVSSTDKRANAKVFGRDGFVDTSAPRALRDEEIPALIDDFRRAAANAIDAGFDGVELHGANTYLLDQFLRDSVNDRSGAYGGSIANRARLLLEASAAVAAEIGAGRVGVRLSPQSTFGGSAPVDSDPQALFGYVVGELAKLGIAFVHVVEGETGGPRHPEGITPVDYAALRGAFTGAWIVNNGYDRALGSEAIASGRADLVAYGRPFIANPDLVRRLREDAPLNPVRFDKLFGGGAEGFTDYPALAG